MVIEQKMHDALRKKCPECGKYALYQDLAGQHTFVYQDPKTLGHLGERNRAKMGKYEIDSNENKHAQAQKLKKKKGNWYNKEGKDLTKELRHLSEGDKKEVARKKHKYIMEGE
jgi:hypothetical protein